MNRLEYAKEFIKSGISIIPLHHRSKAPMLRTWEPYTTILSTCTELHKWLASGWNNYGVICGWGNLVVLDFDNLQWFALWRIWAASVGLGRIVETSFKVLTARGVHVYLRTQAPATNEKRAGIDVQAQRRFVVGPGCTHASGTQYVAVGGFRLVEVPDVATVLPVELFPSVRPGASCGHLEASWGALSADDGLKSATNHTEYQYDPWQSAMFTTDTDLIGAVKSRVRIETLFTDARRTSADGRWLACKCLFHADANPSAWIDVRRQLYGCTVCGFKPMDAINLYARVHNLDDAAAVRAMAQELGVWG